VSSSPCSQPTKPPVRFDGGHSNDLQDPAKRRILKFAISDAEQLRPKRTRAALTQDAAARFAELAASLRSRGHDPMEVAHFVNRLVFCLFADDVDLLPPGLLEKMLEAARRNPSQFPILAGDLFRAMRLPGGRIGFDSIAWFNGGLFDSDATLPLNAADIALLQRAAALDWSQIDPSVLGTLFERGLDPDKRGELGAHYTNREMIMKIIEPVVVRPLLAEWDICRVEIAAAMGRAEAAHGARKAGQAKRAKAQAETLLRGFLDRLRAFRVLDPACGSGNFLYLALLALKDIELLAMQQAEALGLQREFPQVGPEAVQGIEINPYAAELARVSVWIGDIQWARRNGMPVRDDPILRPLKTIECRDAVLDAQGALAPWAQADAIVGNPPFIGGKMMRRALGDATVDKLLSAYKGRVGGEADFVCYWFERAREEMAAGRARRVGLVATNSIRGGANRKVLDRVAAEGRIFDAWSDEAWVLDGAAVRVSVVCWEEATGATPLHLNGQPAARINTDLTGSATDLTLARRLAENRDVAFMGVTPAGPFAIDGETARRWLFEPRNPANGNSNADVVRPYWNAMDITRRPSDRWIVDFGASMSEAQASGYISPFAHVASDVRLARQKTQREEYQKDWWRFARPRPELRAALVGLTRYIATPMVAKHRIFVWLPTSTLPANLLNAIARDDDITFGILHSRFHEAWALRMGTSLGVGNDPRYTPSTTVETFPFPLGMTPDLPASALAAHPMAEPIAMAARALVEARDRWLNPPELVREVSEPVPTLPPRLVPVDAKAEAMLKQRTMTSLYNTRHTPRGRWLDDLHAALDDAVADAYGWPRSISEADVLDALFALNQERASVPASP
jgi:hypothetical protein